jgi:hypothetical protein
MGYRITYAITRTGMTSRTSLAIISSGAGTTEKTGTEKEEKEEKEEKKDAVHAVWEFAKFLAEHEGVAILHATRLIDVQESGNDKPALSASEDAP